MPPLEIGGKGAVSRALSAAFRHVPDARVGSDDGGELAVDALHCQENPFPADGCDRARREEASQPAFAR